MDLQENIPLAPYTTLRIGGPALYFARITDERDLLEAIRFARTQNLPTFVLGGGSNLLVSDEGFPGLVLHLASGSRSKRFGDGTYGPGIIVHGLKDSNPSNRIVTYHVPAGLPWDAFVAITCEASFTGIECMAGIPGTVGGTPVQNVGAYGQEVAQTITQVRALDLDTLTFRTLSRADCAFAYRASIFNTTQRNRYIVTQVSFGFNLDAEPILTYPELRKQFEGKPKPRPAEIAEAVRHIRDRKGMFIDPANPHPDSRSAGSFFKNPVVPAAALAALGDIPNWPTATGEVKLPAAWLIEHAGFPKGFELGPVGISTRHTLALVNRTGTATCADLVRLRDLIVSTVRARFSITLEQEPVFLR